MICTYKYVSMMLPGNNRTPLSWVMMMEQYLSAGCWILDCEGWTPDWAGNSGTRDTPPQHLSYASYSHLCSSRRRAWWWWRWWWDWWCCLHEWCWSGSVVETEHCPPESERERNASDHTGAHSVDVSITVMLMIQHCLLQCGGVCTESVIKSIPAVKCPIREPRRYQHNKQEKTTSKTNISKMINFLILYEILIKLFF